MSVFFEVPKVVVMYNQDLNSLDDLLGILRRKLVSLKLKEGKEVAESRKRRIMTLHIFCLKT